jgi:hypothetical protein
MKAQRRRREITLLSFTSALDGVDGKYHVPAALPPGETLFTHCAGGWVGPRAGLNGCENYPTTGIRLPERPTHSKSLYD